MEYLYSKNENFEDFSSGRVLYNAKGIPNFSVRLLQEMYYRAKSYLKKNEDIIVYDPCCGGGGLAIAALDVLKNDYNVNYAMDCFIECADIDIRCVHMTYLQLALAGVPAIIKHQNTLTQELYSVWKTPAYIFQYPRFCRFQ